MPTTATDHDYTTLRTIEKWKQTTADEVDTIGGWRDADADNLANYWSRGCTLPTSGPPQMPSRFCTETTYLVGEITARYSKLDPAPLQEVYAAIAAWYADRNAGRIPPQPVLFATLEHAMMTLQAVEHDIHTRVLYEDDRDFPDRLIRRLMESSTPPVLTPTELVRLRAHLKAPVRLSELQRNASLRTRRRKLKEILVYNDELKKLQAARVGSPKAAQAPVTDDTQSARKQKHTEWLAQAMLLVRDNPRWSDAAIARRVGKDKSTLARSAEYQTAAALARGEKTDRPAGHIVVNADTGQTDVEAYARPEGKPESTTRRIPGSKYIQAKCRECGEVIRIRPDAEPAEALCEKCGSD